MSAARPVIRVLVVDDSVVARRMVAKAIEDDDELEVSAVAGNGRVALERIAGSRPDVVVLDLEMPEMDGFETLRVLRRTDAVLPVIVFSHLSASGARATLDAMALGASGFALKPSTQSGVATTVITDELLPLIKALARPDAGPTPRGPGAAGGGSAARPAGVEAIVVGVSTGGPQALATLVASLPSSLPVPVLIVQHMPPMFTTMLAERLHALGGPTVSEAVDGEVVQPGHVYIAPGGSHLAVRRDAVAVRVVLGDGPRENSCRPSADVLFRSAADAYRGRVLAVVLTGMGQDGLRGVEAVVSAGGAAIAQDQATSVVGSMPGAVADAGLADTVLPIDRIGPELARRVAVAGARG